jgi:amino acid adenylation domain-containing protein
MATALVAVASTAVCAPLNPEFSLHEWHRYLSELRVTALLIQTTLECNATRAAQDLGIPVIKSTTQQDLPAGLFELAGSLHRPAAGDSSPSIDDDAFVLTTSGTTSRPKVVPLTHANICQSAHNTALALDLGTQDRLLGILPLFHAHGLISGLMSALASGGSVVCTPGFDADQFFASLKEFAPTWYTAVPTIHQAVLAHAGRNEDTLHPCSLRLIRSASASLPPLVLNQLETVFGVPVIETYGMTEAASQIASNPLPPRPRKLGSVGVAAGPKIAILDDDGHLLAPGQTGEIALRGSSIMRGYDGDPAANEAAFTNGWLKTGDLGCFDEDGYLFISGRKKEVINRGGQKIAPREIEDVLTAHPDVAEAVTFAVPHPRLGEDVAAAVVLRPNATTTAREIRRFARAHLAAFKIPRYLQIKAEIPKGPTGKVQRSDMAARLGLTELPSAKMTADGGRVDYGTPLQRQLIEIWRDVLNVDQIGIHDDFFLLGGDSLAATQVVSRIRNRLGRSLSVASFFDACTIADLARHLQTPEPERSDDLHSLVPAYSDHRPFPLSYQQRRLYFLERLGLSGHSYNVFEVARLRGRLDRDALQQSLAAIVARHDVLRSTITELSGEPLQMARPIIGDMLQFKDLERGLRTDRELALDAGIRETICAAFDLRNGPVVRANLLRFDARDHVLVMAFHHLVTDGWSQRLFWDELERHYQAIVHGQPVRAAKPAMQYRHYVAWQRAWIDTAAAKEQLTYWQSQLRGATPLPLKTDRARPKTWLPHGARLPVRVPRRLTTKLKRLGHAHGATLFMTLLAAFQCLLHRYTRHLDIAVGSLIANRNRLEFEQLIGMLSNTLVLRTDFTGDPTFSDVIRRVRGVTLEAHLHQDLPFERVQQALKAPRSLDRNTLFQVLFTLNRAPRPKPHLPELTVSFVPVDPGVARFDLALELMEAGGGLEGWLEYSTELFEASTVTRMARHLRVLLDAVVADPDQPVSSIPLLASRERRQIEVEWQAPQSALPSIRSIHEAFELQSARTSEAVAIVCDRGALRFQELNRHANQLARHLAALGTGRESFVGLLASRTADMVVGVLGILKSGATYVPFDPECPPQRLAFMLEDAQIRIVVTEERLAHRLPQKDLSLVRLDRDWPTIGLGRDRNPERDVSPANLAYVLYTSGSTGTPKGVLGTHGGVLNALQWMWRTFPFDQNEVCCHRTSISFGDSIQELFGPLLRGIPVILLDRERIVDPFRMVEALARHPVTRIVLVPSLLRLLLDSVGDLAGRLPQLKLWISSGEALSQDLARRFRECLPDRRLINIYGASEMSDIVTWCEVDDFGADRKNPPIGRPIANMEIHLLDDSLRPVPVGVPGELCVAGLGLARGYLNRPELDREKFVAYPFSSRRYPRLYRTGDIARFLEDGSIEYLGRRDDQVQIRGCRVELKEVEAALRSHPAVKQAVVVARPEEHEDLRLTAYVLPEDASVLTVNELHRFVRGALPDYMLPSRYSFVDTLPLTSSGKIDRPALAAAGEGVPVSPSEVGAPRSVAEDLLVGIWIQVLKLEHIGVADNFFELGGHSLLAGQLLARVRRVFRVALPLRALFDSPTVAELASQIEASAHLGVSNPELTLYHPDGEGPRRPSIGQEHVLGVERALPGLPIFNLPYGFRLCGRLKVPALARSLSHVVRRHELLRATFAASGAEPALVVALTAEISLTVEDFSVGRRTVRERAARLAAKEEAWTPFDVKVGPLFRIRLLRLADDDHVLLLTIHHAITDGWSVGALLEEISAFYAGFGAGAEAHLPDPPIQFSDFADWQRRWIDGKQAAEQFAYWRQQLSHSLPAFPLAASTTGASLSLNVAHVPVHLPNDLVKALVSFSRREGSTLFITLLTGFKAAIRAEAGQRDLCVATILANRSPEEFENVFGPLENIVLIRTCTDENASFREALSCERDALLEADARKTLPFDTLAARLKSEPDVDWPSLLQVMFVFQNAIRQPLCLSDIEVDPFGDAYRQGQPVLPVSRTLLTLVLRETPSGIIGTCMYKKDQLRPELIERLLNGHRQILAGAIQEPERAASDLTRASHRG